VSGSGDSVSLELAVTLGNNSEFSGEFGNGFLVFSGLLSVVSGFVGKVSLGIIKSDSGVLSLEFGGSDFLGESSLFSFVVLKDSFSGGDGLIKRSNLSLEDSELFSFVLSDEDEVVNKSDLKVFELIKDGLEHLLVNEVLLDKAVDNFRDDSIKGVNLSETSAKSLLSFLDSVLVSFDKESTLSTLKSVKDGDSSVDGSDGVDEVSLVLNKDSVSVLSSLDSFSLSSLGFRDGGLGFMDEIVSGSKSGSKLIIKESGGFRDGVFSISLVLSVFGHKSLVGLGLASEELSFFDLLVLEGSLEVIKGVEKRGIGASSNGFLEIDKGIHEVSEFGVLEFSEGLNKGFISDS